MKKVGQTFLSVENEIDIESQTRMSDLLDPILHFYINRCKNLQIQKDAGLFKEWSGVFEFMDK